MALKEDIFSVLTGGVACAVVVLTVLATASAAETILPRQALFDDAPFSRNLADECLVHYVGDKLVQKCL